MLESYLLIGRYDQKVLTHWSKRRGCVIRRALMPICDEWQVRRTVGKWSCTEGAGPTQGRALLVKDRLVRETKTCNKA